MVFSRVSAVDAADEAQTKKSLKKLTLEDV